MAFFDFQMTLGEAHSFRSPASVAMFINMYAHLQNIFNCCQMFLPAPDLWLLWIKQHQVLLVRSADLVLTVKAVTFHNISVVLLLLTPCIIDSQFSFSLFFILFVWKLKTACLGSPISSLFPAYQLLVCVRGQWWVLTNVLQFSLKRILRDHTILWQGGGYTRINRLLASCSLLTWEK